MLRSEVEEAAGFSQPAGSVVGRSDLAVDPEVEWVAEWAAGWAEWVGPVVIRDKE